MQRFPRSRPSGSVLPQYLLNKRIRTGVGVTPTAPPGISSTPLSQPQQTDPQVPVPSNATNNEKEGDERCTQQQQQQPPTKKLTKADETFLANRAFTSGELEDLSLKITTAMIGIQKQIYRGEETYYEDTYAHGSLFRGWDAIVDAKDIVAAAGSSSAPPPTTRRVPSDMRWFSGSCRSVARNARPSLIKTFQHIHGSRPASATQQLPDAAFSGSLPRSETNTPTPTASNENFTAAAAGTSVVVKGGNTATSKSVVGKKSGKSQQPAAASGVTTQSKIPTTNQPAQSATPQVVTQGAPAPVPSSKTEKKVAATSSNPSDAAGVKRKADEAGVAASADRPAKVSNVPSPNPAAN